MRLRNLGPGDRQVLWLIPILLTLHNLEEAIAMRRFLPSLKERTPAAIGAVLAQVDYHGFLVALIIATVLPFAIVWWVWVRPESRVALWAALGIQAVVALNVLSHIAAAIVFGGYSPGLATAVLVNLPFSAYLFSRAWIEGWTTTARLSLLLLAALIVHGPLLVGLLLLTGALRL
jgi:hypothetical protein